MLTAAGSLAESEGAGEVRSEGGDDGSEAEGGVAISCTRRVGDVGGAGGAGESTTGPWPCPRLVHGIDHAHVHVHAEIWI